MNAVPEGWRQRQRLSPFNALVGPLYERRSGGESSLGLRVEEKHANSRGICHGGVLATLADVALGYAIHSRVEEGEARGFVTVQLSIDYAGSARIGGWIEAEVRIQRIGSRLAFADCYLVRRGVALMLARPVLRR